MNTKATTEEVKDLITVVLDIVESIDKKSIEALAEVKDTELRRSRIADLIIQLAHKTGQLKTIKTVSSMRELLYNLVASDTQKSKDFHKELEAKPADTIKDICSSPTARVVFMALYPKKMEKVLTK